MKTAVAVLFAMFLVVGPVGATLIDFSTSVPLGISPGFGPAPPLGGSPAGTVLSTQYSGLGVLFSNSVSPDGINFVSNGDYYATGLGTNNVLMVNTNPLFGSPAGFLTIQFAGTVAGSSINFFVKDTEWVVASVRVQTFGLTGPAIETWDLASESTIHAFTTGSVNRIVFTDLGGDGLLIDDLNFGAITPSDIPEPGTVGLLGAGLVALGLISRRLRRS